MSLANIVSRLATKITEVFDAGKKKEWNEFWDAYQQNGKRTNYKGAFYGVGWTPKKLMPKHDIKPTEDGAYQMFGSNASNADLVANLEECGVSLDFSGVTKTASYIFSGAKIKHLGVIDLSNLTGNNASVFNALVCDKIDLLIVGENVTFQTWFNNCTIKDITFGGTIGQNIDFHWCTQLSHDNLMSAINCLKDYSGTSGTHTLTIGTNNLAKLTDSEKAIATQRGWTLA